MLFFTYPSFDGYRSVFLGDWKCLDGLYHQVSWKITAYETDHLMVVQSSDGMIVRRTVKHLADLLQKAFSVELGSRNESVFSQEDMFTF